MMNKRVAEITHPVTGRTMIHTLPFDTTIQEAIRAMERNIMLNRGTVEGKANEERLEAIRKLADAADGI